jgi:hypothetical protein
LINNRLREIKKTHRAHRVADESREEKAEGKQTPLLQSRFVNSLFFCLLWWKSEMEQKEVHNHLPKSHSELPFVVCLCVLYPLLIYIALCAFTIALQKWRFHFQMKLAIEL